MRTFIALTTLIASAHLATAQTYIIPQVADGGGWKTTLAVTNTTTSPANAALTCHRDTTGGATETWNLPLAESGAESGVSVPSAATIYLHTPGTASALSVGWCELRADSGLSAYAVFTASTGSSVFEGTAVASEASGRSLVPFDNSGNLTTSIAIVNTSPAEAAVSVGIRTVDGTVTQTSLGTVPAYGHLAFESATRLSATSRKSGLLEFHAGTESLSVIALRFNSTGSFTSAPTYPAAGTPIIGSAPGAAAAVKSVTLQTASVGSGAVVTGTVTLTGAAPAGGAVVALSSSNPGAASVPGTVTVAGGSNSASFTVTAVSVMVAQTTTITASYGGSSASAPLTVTPAASGRVVSFSAMNCSMTYQPVGDSSADLWLAVTPDAGNIILSGQLLGLDDSNVNGKVKGYSPDDGDTFVFNQIASGGVRFRFGGEYYDATSIQVALSLSNRSHVGSTGMAGVTGTLTVTGPRSYVGGSPVTVTATLRGDSSHGCVLTY